MLESTARFVLPALLIVCLPAFYPTAAGAVPPKNAPDYARAVAQADGITNRVIDGLNTQSDRYFHEGDYNRVIGLMRVMVEADPNFNQGYTNAAFFLWSQGAENPARRDGYNAAADALLRQGLARTRDKGELAFECGFQFFRTKRYAQAEPYLAQSIALPNPEPRYFSQLALCYEKNSKIPQAIATWRALVAKFSSFPAGPPNLRRILAGQSIKP